MMKVPRWLPFLLMILGFLPYFFRQDLTGADTYYFANFVCGKYEKITTAPLSYLIFKLLPCEIFEKPAFAKLLLLSIALLCTYLVYDELGARGATFLFLSPVWITEFWKFEDDQLSFPLLLLSWKFWRRGKLNEAFLFALLACMLWRGAVIWILFYGIQGYIPAVILSLPIIPYLAPHLLPDVRIQERIPGFAIFLWMMNLGGVLEMHPLGWLWVIAGFLNAKWSFWAVPFLAEGVNKVFDRLKPDRKILLWIILGITVVGTSFSVFRTPPTQEQWQAIRKAVELANGSWICGDWDLGYWIDWAGGKAWAHAGPGNECWKGVVVTRRVLKCFELAKTKRYNVYNC